MEGAPLITATTRRVQRTTAEELRTTLARAQAHPSGARRAHQATQRPQAAGMAPQRPASRTTRRDTQQQRHRFWHSTGWLRDGHRTPALNVYAQEPGYYGPGGYTQPAWPAPASLTMAPWMGQAASATVFPTLPGWPLPVDQQESAAAVTTDSGETRILLHGLLAPNQQNEAELRDLAVMTRPRTASSAWQPWRRSHGSSR
jgi:hypothetical protein